MKDHFWLPRVHIVCGELCTLYFLQLTKPFAKAPEELEALAKGSVLRSYRIYPLYGKFDFVVVVWGAEDKQQNFLLTLERDLLISKVASHKATQAIPDLGEVTESEIDVTHIPEVVGQFYRTDNDKIQPETLKTQNWLFKVPKSTERTYRFFTIIEYESTLDASEVIQRFKSLSKNSNLHLSIYDAESPRRDLSLIILETVSKEYDGIYKLLQKLAQNWSVDNRSETYVVSASDAIERDDVDTNWVESNRDSKALIDFVGHPRAFVALKSLEIQSQRSLEEKYKRYRTEIWEHGVNKHPFESTMRSLLLALILDDEEYLINAATFFVRLEGYFSKVIWNSWKEVLPKKNWYQIVETKGKGSGLTNFSPSKFTLGEGMSVSNSIPEVKKYLDDLLYPDWFERINSIVELRNDFAHGRVVTEPRFEKDGVDTWGIIADKIMGVGGLYNAVVQRYDLVYKASDG